jgi:uncharacterized SAM-binding protein YcdF (DUF218 family)
MMEPSTFFWFKKWVGVFTDPLTTICIFALVTAVIFALLPNRFKVWRYPAFMCTFGVLWMLSTPAVSFLLMAPIEDAGRTGVFDFPVMEADVIVVLGCGHIESDYVPLSSRYQNCSMRRVVHAILLHRETGLPIVFSGGKMPGTRYSEAHFNRNLALQLGVYIENTVLSSGAIDTAGEAIVLAKTWKGKGIVLVTTASHMRRAMTYMTRAGMRVHPSPTDHSVKVRDLNFVSAYAYLPRWSGLKRTGSAVYERLGLLSQDWFE